MKLLKTKNRFTAKVKTLNGVWATGKTLEACRANLINAVEDWILFSVAQNLPIPTLGGVSLRLPKKVCRLMPKLTPISRRKLIKRLRANGICRPLFRR